MSEKFLIKKVAEHWKGFEESIWGDLKEEIHWGGSNERYCYDSEVIHW